MRTREGEYPQYLDDRTAVASKVVPFWIVLGIVAASKDAASPCSCLAAGSFAMSSSSAGG